MLSTMEEIDEQSAWIENQLKNTDKKWKFAMFHFPPYSFDEDKYPEVVKEWGALFDKYHLVKPLHLKMIWILQSEKKKISNLRQ